MSSLADACLNESLAAPKKLAYDTKSAKQATLMADSSQLLTPLEPFDDEMNDPQSLNDSFTSRKQVAQA